MFETVLVADRGACAHRVVQTCQRLGARTVVVHSADDGQAPAVRVADEAVPLGGAGWAESYGDPVRVVEAARRTGAEAVHPGAGWLAQDAALARAVLAEGLVWLGLPPQALELADADLARAAGQQPAGPHGRPLVATVLGDGVLGDGGAARVLGLRELRRAAGGAPLADLAPAELPEAARLGCEAAALAVVRTAGAGALAAVALVVDGERVGVAGVLPPLLPGCSATELTSGLDLVEVQLRAASGETAEQGTAHRHALALHLRVPDRFAGRLRRCALPDDAGVRVEASVQEGDRVLVGSDRTLAVLTVAADDPARLPDRAAAALAAVRVEGVPTSLPALRALVERLEQEAA